MGNKTLFLAPCHGHAASFYDEGFTGVCHKGEAACVCHPDTFSETNRCVRAGGTCKGGPLYV